MRDITIARCPQCLAPATADHPNRWRCGSRKDGTHQSMVCEAAEKRRKEMPSFLIPENKRLQAIVNGHPTTKDGQVITWGDRLWVVSPDTSGEFEEDNSWADWITVRDMEPPYPNDPPRWLIISVGSIDGCFFNDECYSSKAAAPAAKEKP